MNTTASIQSDGSLQSGPVPGAWEVVALGAASLICLLLFTFGAYDTVNLIIPIAIIVIMGAASWILVKRDGAAVWTPLFGARLSALTYLGVGSLLPNILDEESYDYVLQLYPNSPEEGAKVNLLFIAGLFIFIGSAKLTSLLWPSPKTNHSTIRFSSHATLLIGIIFFFLGTIYTAFIYLPSQFGTFNYILPGSLVTMFAALGAAGAFMIALWAFQRRGAAYLLVLLVLAICLLLSVLTLLKATFMLPLLMVALAFLLTGVSWSRGLFLVVVFSATLMTTQPMVNYGRALQVMTYQNEPGGSVAERLDYGRRYWNGEPLPFVQRDISSFTRLVFIPVASFVVSRYDTGQRSHAIEGGLYALIPRALWPDKPVVNVGAELNYILVGNENSNTGATLFGDLYWNFGWLGLVLLIPFGVYCWWASCVSRRVVADRDWIMMPFTFMAFLIGASMDNGFLLTVFAPMVLSLFAYGALRVVAHLLAEAVRRAR